MEALTVVFERQPVVQCTVPLVKGLAIMSLPRLGAARAATSGTVTSVTNHNNLPHHLWVWDKIECLYLFYLYVILLQLEKLKFSLACNYPKHSIITA